MNPAPPSQVIGFPEADIQGRNVGIRSVAERLSAPDLETALSVSWDECLRAFRNTSSLDHWITARGVG